MTSTGDGKREGKKGQGTNNDDEPDDGESSSEKGRSRPPTRGSDCPCGSGMKYKKCCMAREKSKKRLAKHIEKNRGTGNDDDNVDKKKEERFIGEFKVLTI